MKNLKIIILSAVVLSFSAIPLSVHAQSAVRINQHISDLNQIKPLQNPAWQRSADVLKSRILDRKNKVVGDLEDIIVGQQGVVDSLKVDLNRLQLGTEVYLNYNNMNIRSAERAYITNFDDDRIEEIYPELLANIESASGGDNGLISIKNLNNADVEAEDGRRLGKVEEIMFDINSGNRAEALIIRVRASGIRGTSVAVPFYMPRYDVESATRYNVVVSNAEADAILDVARTK